MLSGAGKTTFVSGPAGPPNVLMVRNVATGAPGSLAAAQTGGVAPNQWLDLTIPQGQTGATGAVPWAPIVAWYTGQICTAAAPATLVYVNGAAYVCTLAHIAGTFAADLAAGKWAPVAPGGLQPWQTPPVAWAASTAYTATAPASCVTYGGGCYVCTTAHTSGPGFDQTKWTQIAAPGQAPGALQAANNLSDLASAIAAQGYLGELPTPQGRLTLTGGMPVMGAAVAGAGTVFYTPVGRLALVGTGLSSPPVPMFFGEVAQALSDASKSPSAAAAGQAYDYFAWSDGGTFRVTRGPAWMAGATAGSNVARGAGAGSTALTRVFGILVNANAIANGPAAGMGVYVGTIATDVGGATVSFNTGSAAAGGGAATIGLWNAYNRAPVRGFVKDTVGQYQYGTASWRSANGSATNRVTFVTGGQEDWWRADYSVVASGNTSGYTAIGLGYDTTTAPTGVTGYVAANAAAQASAIATVQPLGAHFLAPIEYVSAGTSTFNGGGYLAPIQPGLIWEGRY